MCEYWKSVPMWRCPYCKCNIQDTKAARKFHESGKRHKEALERYMLEMGIKGYQRQRARNEVERELRIIEAAALSSYMTHDMNGVLHSVPEKEIKDISPTVDKPLREEYATVSTNTTSIPEYGTPAYAEWYYAWKRYHASQGDEKAMAHISHPGPKEDYAKQSQPSGQQLHGKGSAEGGGKGAPNRRQDRPKATKPPQAPRPQVQVTSSPPAAPVPGYPAQPSMPPAMHQSPTPAAAAPVDDDDELESFNEDEEEGYGLRMTDWTTVAVRPLQPPRQSVEEDETPAGGGHVDREDVDEDEDSDDGHDHSAFQSLNFNFSKKPSGSRGGATGFRVTNYSADHDDDAPGPQPRTLGAVPRKEATVKKEPIVKKEPSADDASYSLAQRLVPLAEMSRRSMKIETVVKLEPQDECIHPEGTKRKQSRMPFAMRSTKQFRRRLDEDED